MEDPLRMIRSKYEKYRLETVGEDTFIRKVYCVHNKALQYKQK